MKVEKLVSEPFRHQFLCPTCGGPRSQKSIQCMGCYRRRLRESAKLEFVSRGYVYVYAPGHSRATKRGYVKRAILILEEKLGRPLEPGEVAHHKGAKDDDRPEMLETKGSQSAHAKGHELGGRKRTTWKPGDAVPRPKKTLEGHQRLSAAAKARPRNGAGRFRRSDD